MAERKLAHIELVHDITPIEGARYEISCTPASEVIDNAGTE